MVIRTFFFSLEPFANNNYETNTVTNIIEYDENAHNGNTDTPGVDSKYRITGTAWNDANKNGERESEEELLSGIEVILLDKSAKSIIKVQIQTIIKNLELQLIQEVNMNLEMFQEENI